MNPKIVVADDEPDVLSLVGSNLRRAGFEVVEVEDGEAALEKTRQLVPDLLILDLMLPHLSGLDVCRSLKADAATAGIPIIMLTAKAEEIDRVVGLELGADDYVTKPFSPRELVLRVKGMLRRTGRNRDEDLLASGSIVVDRGRMQVSVAGSPVEVTATELKLLAVLIERRGRVQSRDALLNDVWGYENAIDTRTVDTHIKRLREKLGEEASRIETVRGFGYRIAD
ncbi:MAG TPA: response regulator transcription factor [Chthoniobacteraceae bacterium]|nr:response regulator transcription factor [Chthoniobacteraceae bacterium]